MTNKPKCFYNSIKVETGLSLFHKMTTTVSKTHFRKQNPKLIVYRKYKNYDNLLFQEEFLSKLKDLLSNDRSLKGFQDPCLQILNYLTPLKAKYVRANRAPFMNKDLQKAFTIRSKLRIGFLKGRTESNRKTYTLFFI